jgi:hypothetical protein
VSGGEGGGVAGWTHSLFLFGRLQSRWKSRLFGEGVVCVWWEGGAAHTDLVRSVAVSPDVLERVGVLGVLGIFELFGILGVLGVP